MKKAKPAERKLPRLCISVEDRRFCLEMAIKSGSGDAAAIKLAAGYERFLSEGK